jgi:hypothetical protein
VLLAEAGESLPEQAALIAFLWRSAPMLSLAHDVSDGGLELAVREATEWSGRAADVGRAEAPCGAVLLTCAREHISRLDWDVNELGTVR